MEKKEFNFYDYVYVLVKWKKLIILNSVIICTLAVLVSLIIPRWFISSTTILSATDQGGALSLSSLVGNLPASGFLSKNLSDETNLFLAILNSRTVMESLVDKYDLKKRYKSKTMEAAVKNLRKCISTDVNEDGTLTISIQTKTPYFPNKKKDLEAKELSQKMVEFTINELDRINRRIKLENATNYRVSIENRYIQNQQDLKKAEEEFRAFQEKYGTISLEDQTEATLKAAAELNAKLVSKQVELGILSQYVDDKHNSKIELQREIKEIKSKLEEFKYGFKESDKVQNGSKSELFVNLSSVPEMGVQYVRLYREIKMQELLTEFLLPQYEQAKIEEAKNTPTVQVLDEPKLPEKKFKPRRVLFVLFWGIFSLFSGIIMVFLIEYFNRLKNEGKEDYFKLQNIMSELRLNRLSRGKRH